MLWQAAQLREQASLAYTYAGMLGLHGENRHAVLQLAAHPNQSTKSWGACTSTLPQLGEQSLPPTLLPAAAAPALLLRRGSAHASASAAVRGSGTSATTVSVPTSSGTLAMVRMD